MEELVRINSEYGLEKAVEYLFKNKFDQMESVKLLVQYLKIPLKQADHAVQNHVLWRKYKKGNDDLKDMFLS